MSEDKTAVLNISLRESALRAFERDIDREVTVPRNARKLQDDELTASVSLSDVGREAVENPDQLTRALAYWVHSRPQVRAHARR